MVQLSASGPRVLREIEVRVVARAEEAPYQAQLAVQHYLGALPRIGETLWLLETFVDPRRFHGGVYRAANWIELGMTRGFRRVRGGYSEMPDAPKRVFVLPLARDARAADASGSFLPWPDWSSAYEPFRAPDGCPACLLRRDS